MFFPCTISYIYNNYSNYTGENVVGLHIDLRRFNARLLRGGVRRDELHAVVRQHHLIGDARHVVHVVDLRRQGLATVRARPGPPLGAARLLTHAVAGERRLELLAKLPCEPEGVNTSCGRAETSA